MERLGELVRALVADHPELDVHTDVRDAETVPEGSVMVLVPRPEDAEWLNLRRPLFARRALKVVLFCDRETTVALAQRAVDFFDWVSQHHECPPGPVPHAVLGLRAAAEAEAPGILWIGAEDPAEAERMWGAFSTAFPGETLRWVSARSPCDYENLVAGIRSAGSAWIACHVEWIADIRRLRWALAEATRRSRVLAIAPPLSCPGWWTIHDRLMSLVDARRHLEEVGLTHPGCLAALANLEPEAVDLARKLAERGLSHRDFVMLLGEAPDPGAALALRALDAGLLDHARIALGDAPMPALRALSRSAEVRRRRSELLTAVREALTKRREVSAETVGLWASMTSMPPRIRLKGARLDAAALAFVMESQLRRRLSAAAWAELAHQALDLGDIWAAGAWAARSAAKWPILPNTPFDIMNRIEELNERHAHRVMDSSIDVVARRVGLLLAIMTILGVALLGLLVSSPRSTAAGLLSLLASAAFLCATLYAFVNYWRLRRTLSRIYSKRSALRRDMEAALDGEDLDRAALILEGEMIRGELGEGHPAYRRALGRLAVRAADGADEDEDEALTLLSDALALEGRLAGLDQPSFAALVVSLAGLLGRRGSPAEAEALLRKLLGPEAESPHGGRAALPPEMAVTSLPGREARTLVQLFLARDGAPLKLAPEDRVRALRYLAGALSSQGRYDEAENIACIAQERAAQVLPAAHPEQWRTLAVVGRVLALQHRDDDAAKALRSAVNLAQEAFGERHIDFARTLLELARVKSRRRDPDAAAVTRKALDAYAEARCSADERDAALRELNALNEHRGDAPQRPAAGRSSE